MLLLLLLLILILSLEIELSSEYIKPSDGRLNQAANRKGRNQKDAEKEG